MRLPTPVQESIRDIAASACATHKEDRSTWKHGWSCITNDQRHDGPALWVWVNEILLDSTNQALVLDCCILPVDRMDHEASLQLGIAIGHASTHFIQVTDILLAFPRQRSATLASASVIRVLFKDKDVV